MSNSTASPQGNPYAPQEPANILYLEHMSFAGNNMGEIFYGITLLLFFQCLRAILHPRNRKSPLNKMVFVVYVTVMFGLATIFTAMNIHLEQLSYIDNRNYPSGPIGYSLAAYSTWRVTVPNACSIIANWLADGLLMYRCYVVYNMASWILFVPGIMYLSSISMGTIVLYKSSRPDSSLWSGVTVNYGLPYFSISCGLNVLLTVLISARLLAHNHQMRKAMPNSSSSSLYRNVITMLIESCALYAVTSLLFIGPYAANNYASDLFLPILSQVQIIAPYLIILRVANQSAVTSTMVTTTNPSRTISFKTRGPDSSAADGSTMDFELNANLSDKLRHGSSLDVAQQA